MICPIDGKECPKERTELSFDGDPNCFGIQASIPDYVKQEEFHPTFRTKILVGDIMSQCLRYDREKANKIFRERLAEHDIKLISSEEELRDVLRKTLGKGEAE